MKVIFTDKDVCDVSSEKFQELTAKGFNGVATFFHLPLRALHLVLPAVELKMRNPITLERIAIRFVGKGDENVTQYSCFHNA